LVVMEITASTYDVDRMAPGRIAAFAPPLALMGLIYFLSAQPDLNSGLGLVDEIGRKLVHMAEYGLLWWLWCRAFGFRRPVLAAVITLAYAATDEFHQTFVHGRVGSPVDWGIDAAGVAIAWTAWAANRRRVRSSRAG
jgi:VanZ family protein